MRWSTAAILLGGMFASSDVMPRCGTKRTVQTVGAGAHCGYQGRDFLAECREPAQCTHGKRAHATICTVPCTTDADCAALDPPLRCTELVDAYGPDANAGKLCSRLPPAAPDE